MAWKVWAVVGGYLLISWQIRKSEWGGGVTHMVPPLLSASHSVFNPGPQPIGWSKVGPTPQSILSGNTPKDVHTQRYASLISA